MQMKCQKLTFHSVLHKISWDFMNTKYGQKKREPENITF